MDIDEATRIIDAGLMDCGYSESDCERVKDAVTADQRAEINRLTQALAETTGMLIRERHAAREMEEAQAQKIAQLVAERASLQYGLVETEAERNKWFQTAVTLHGKLNRVYNHIEHGDEAHRQWLWNKMQEIINEGLTPETAP